MEQELIGRGRVEVLRDKSWGVMRQELRRFIAQRYCDASQQHILTRWRRSLRRRIVDHLRRDERLCQTSSGRWTVREGAQRSMKAPNKTLTLEIDRWKDRAIPSLVRGEELGEHLWATLSHKSEQLIPGKLSELTPLTSWELTDNVWNALSPRPEPCASHEATWLKAEHEPEASLSSHTLRAEQARRFAQSLSPRVREIARAYIWAEAEVSQHQLAQQLGLTQSTVSYTLREDGTLARALSAFAEREALDEAGMRELIDRLARAL